MDGDTDRSIPQWPAPVRPMSPPAPPVSPDTNARSAAVGRATAVAMISAGVGWLIMLYGLLAESDTGHPDGLACTKRQGAAYESCMYNSEQQGLIAWAATLGLAGLGVALLLRAWRSDRPVRSQRGLFGVALVGSGSLLAAGLAVWVHGVRGGWYADKLYYEDSVGAVWWTVAMCIGLTVGLAVALLISLPKLEDHPA